MDDNTPFSIESGLSYDELSYLSIRLKERFPKLYEILTNPGTVEEELYERATGGLVRYLREDEEITRGEDRFKIYKIQRDLVHFLAGRFNKN